LIKTKGNLYCLGIFPPTPVEVVLNPHIIEDLADGLADKVLNGLGVIIEGGYGGKDMGAHISGRGHELQVALVKGCLPNQEHQFPSLL